MPSIPSASPAASNFQAVADQRVLAGVAATLTATLLDQDGSAADAAGAVTVQIARSDGTVLVAAGTAATHGANGSGTYTIPLTAAQTLVLDTLTAVWTDATTGATHTTHAEVVGGYWFTVAEARASDPTLADTSKYPTADIVAVRREVEDEAERIIGVACVPRYNQVVLWGGGSDYLVVPDRFLRSLRSMSWGGLSMSADGLANTVLTAEGRIQRYWPYLSNASDDSWGRWGQRFPHGTRVTVGYEHGLDRPPADLKRAALLRLRHRLNANKSGISDRAVSFSSVEGGTFSLATPGRAGWETGIPDVDSIYLKYQAMWGARPTVGSLPIA